MLSAAGSIGNWFPGLNRQSWNTNDYSEIIIVYTGNFKGQVHDTVLSALTDRGKKVIFKFQQYVFKSNHTHDLNGKTYNAITCTLDEQMVYVNVKKLNLKFILCSVSEKKSILHYPKALMNTLHLLEVGKTDFTRQHLCLLVYLIELLGLITWLHAVLSYPKTRGTKHGMDKKVSQNTFKKLR